MRRKARVDGNQAEIVAGLRRIGASVRSVAGVGAGFPDLAVGFRGRNYLLECKDPRQVPSKRVLTPAEDDFHAEWTGQVAIVETAEEAIKVVMNG